MGSFETTLAHDMTSSRRSDTFRDSTLNATMDFSFDNEIDIKKVDRSVKEAIFMANNTVQVSFN